MGANWFNEYLAKQYEAITGDVQSLAAGTVEPGKRIRLHTEGSWTEYDATELPKDVPVRGPDGQLIEGAVAHIDADDRGINTTITFPGLVPPAFADRSAMSWKLGSEHIPLLGDLSDWRPAGLLPGGQRAWADDATINVQKVTGYLPVSQALLDEIDSVNQGQPTPFPRQPWRTRLKWWISRTREAAGRRLYAMVSGGDFPDPDDYDRDDW